MRLKNFLRQNKVLLFLTISGFVFMGCTSLVPLTDEILGDFGGEESIEGLQYYTSTKITLYGENASSSNKVFAGQATTSNKITSNKIVLSRSTPGIAIAHYRAVDNRWVLQVAFEEGSDNFLYFGKVGELYVLLYQDGVNNRIKYGGVWYTVPYDDNKPPYLLIKKNANLIKENNSRKVRGRALQD
jgi:hypothetical protein